MRLTDMQWGVRWRGIGASESGAILGLDKYTTEVDVYFRKVAPKQVIDADESQAVYWGHRRECIISEEYGARTGHWIIPSPETRWSKEYPFMFCHLDYEAPNEDRIVEIKTASAYVSKDWGESGTNQVPDTYKCQVTHQMIVTGYKCADIAVLINGNDFRIYTVPYDEVLAKIIIEKEKHFWTEHVMAKIPPEPKTLGDLDLLYADDDGSTVVADEAAENAVTQRGELDGTLKYLATEKERMDMVIKGCIGDGSVLVNEDGDQLATWKGQETKRLDQKRIKEEYPDIAKDCLATTKSRVLRIKRFFNE